MLLGRDADGASFSYGALAPGGSGSRGSTTGLALQFDCLPAPTSVRLLYDGVRLLSARLPSASSNATDGSRVVHVEIAYGRASHGGDYDGLTLLVDGVALLRGAAIDAWHPQPSWAFGFSASSGRGAARCAVRRVRLRSGALVEPQPAPLHITRNGQDFVSAAPLPARTTAVRSSARSRLVGPHERRLSAAHRGRGPPRRQLVLLPLRRPARCAGAQHHLLRALCALRDAAAPLGGVVVPQLALNAADETESRVAFLFYAPPSSSPSRPPQGPALGGTAITLSATGLSLNGSQPVCRLGAPMWRRDFGEMSAQGHADSLAAPMGVGARVAHGLAPNEVWATVSSTEARCTLPPSVGGPHVRYALQLSLNGHDFTAADGVDFTYYADAPQLVRRLLITRTHTRIPPPTPDPHPNLHPRPAPQLTRQPQPQPQSLPFLQASVRPTSDSSVGGRPITLHGVGLANGSAPQCRYRGDGFGVQRVNATVLSDTALACPSATLPPTRPRRGGRSPKPSRWSST